MTQWLDVSDTDPRVSYTVGASERTTFTVPFIFFEDGDLEVFVDGVQFELTTHYTVAGAEDPNGGTVTFVSPRLNCVVLIQRNIPLVLDTHIPPSGPLDVPSINIQFSKLVAMIQQISALSGQDTAFISSFMETLLDDANAAAARATLGVGSKYHAGGDVLPRTCWIEPDALQPGIITRENQAGAVSLTSTYVTEKLTALHEQGYRRFIIVTITDNGRTYTVWNVATPVDPSGTTYHFWYEDVHPSVAANVESFDILEHIFDVCDGLDGAQVIVGLGRHDDLLLLNDLADGGADPLRFGMTETERITYQIARYTAEAADVYSRFGARQSFRGFYISHETDNITSSVRLYRPLADVLAPYGEVHVSAGTPTDFADSNAIADVLNSFRADWIWAQTHAGEGYNWSTGMLSYVSQISVFGSAGHLSDWRALIERARGRSGATTVTITIAAPAKVTWAAHGWANGTAIILSTSGALPTGLTGGSTYFLKNVGTNDFELAATPSGTSITATGSQFGTHTGTVTARAPKLGIVVEAWRRGVQGAGILTFGATSGSGVTVTLGTTSSIVAADIGKDIYVRADQATGIARVVSITDTTHVVVNITENLVDVNIASTFWALVPDLTDIVIDTYPAPASEAAVEITTCAGFVDDISVYAEPYWDPGNLSLRLTQAQGPVTNYRDRAIDGWNDHAVNLSDATNAARFHAWANRGFTDPAADAIVFWDDSADGGEGGYRALSMPAAGLAISGTALALANDLAGIEGLATTGLARRTGTSTWTAGSSVTVAEMGSTSYCVAVIGFKASAVNFNSANTDTAISISLPTGFTRYAINAVRISNASTSLTTATCGVFTAAAAAGVAIVSGGTAITVSATADATNNNTQSLTLNNSTTESYTAATLYFRVGTAQGVAATGDAIIVISVLG